MNGIRKGALAASFTAVGQAAAQGMPMHLTRIAFKYGFPMQP